MAAICGDSDIQQIKKDEQIRTCHQKEQVSLLMRKEEGDDDISTIKMSECNESVYNEMLMNELLLRKCWHIYEWVIYD